MDGWSLKVNIRKLLQWTAGTCVRHFVAHPELSWFHNCMVLFFALRGCILNPPGMVVGGAIVKEIPVQ